MLCHFGRMHGPSCARICTSLLQGDGSVLAKVRRVGPPRGTRRCRVGCAVPTCSSVIWKAVWKSKILTECGMTAWLSCSPLTTILRGAREWGTGSTTSGSRAGGRRGGLHAGTATKGLSPPGAGCGEVPAAAVVPQLSDCFPWQRATQIPWPWKPTCNDVHRNPPQSSKQESGHRSHRGLECPKVRLWCRSSLKGLKPWLPVL